MLKTFFRVIAISTFLFLISQELQAAQFLSFFPNGKKPDGVVYFFSLFMAFVVALGVHELGHLITGMVQKFRFELFVIFLLGIKRTDKGIKVFLNKNLGFMGGIAATVPITKDPKNRKKFARMVIAGPIASLVFAAISFLFVAYTSNITWSFWLFSGATSLAIFFATTIPKKSGMFFTDRARYQRLKSHGQAGKSEEALLELITQTTIDNDYKNISIEKARVLQKDYEPIMQFWGYYYEYKYYQENNLQEQAISINMKLVEMKSIVSSAVWKALEIN